MFFLTEKAGKFDGYLVAPHGATVSDEYPDADGHWLYKLRQRVGDPEHPSSVPWICMLTSFSKRMIEVH